jgi:hypothetical protein
MILDYAVHNDKHFITSCVKLKKTKIEFKAYGFGKSKTQALKIAHDKVLRAIINFDNNKMINAEMVPKDYYNIVRQGERENSKLIKLFGYYHLKNTIQNLQGAESNVVKHFKQFTYVCCFCYAENTDQFKCKEHIFNHFTDVLVYYCNTCDLKFNAIEQELM